MEIVIPVMGFFSVVGIFVAFYIARKVGRFLNVRTLLILNYVLVSLVSGIAHLAQVEGAYRGFYDVAGAGTDGLVTATLGSIVGLLALCLGSFWRLAKASATNRPTLRGADRWIIVIALLATTPLALLGLTRMQAQAAESGVVRQLTTDAGEARYVFLSHWTVWVISFVVILVMNRRRPLRAFGSMAVVLSGVALIAATLSWTGGRSIIFVMALPLLIEFAYRFRRAYWLAIPLGGLAALAYVISITQERTAGTRTGSSLVTWLDWEWGRFSLLGFADSVVQKEGLLWGETFVAATSNVVLGLVRLAGIYVPNPDVRPMQSITGEFILGTTDTYVVGGLNAELYINFGYIGIVVGMILLGVFAGYVDRRFASSANVLTQFAWAYLGALIVFRTLAADANALANFFVYSGAPILIVALVARAVPDRSTRGDSARGGRHLLASVDAREAKAPGKKSSVSSIS